MHIEVVRQQLEERRHQETTSAMYFDHDWQGKLTRGTFVCLRVLLLWIECDCVSQVSYLVFFQLAMTALVEFCKVHRMHLRWRRF
jgi:hypothetical protein